jgi:hypothetical protein
MLLEVPGTTVMNTSSRTSLWWLQLLFQGTMVRVDDELPAIACVVPLPQEDHDGVQLNVTHAPLGLSLGPSETAEIQKSPLALRVSLG